MSLDTALTDEEPVTRLDALLAPFAAAQKPPSQWLVGLEHEKLPYRYPGWTAVPYEGERGIGALLERLAPRGYTAFRETPDGPAIAMTRGVETVSLEPGGQVELSGRPHATAREAHAENVAHLAELSAVAAEVGVRLVTLGYRPFGTVGDMPWMPKSRYRVMRKTLGPRGALALDMMLLTATGQVSLDWDSEEDCVRKTVLSARLTPVLVALFANSPIVRGEDSGWQSYRSRVWHDVDRSRGGYLDAWFDGTFSYRAYVEWALDAPLLFLRRRGTYLTPPVTFRRLMKEGFEGAPPTMGDWKDHLSTLFPEVRLKRVIEIRAADSNGAPLTGALVALMRGLLYDRRALADAEVALPRLEAAPHRMLHAAAAREGLGARTGTRTLAEVARDVVAIARQGLERLDPLDAPLLEPLEEVAARGTAPAVAVRELFRAHPHPDGLLGAVALSAGGAQG